MKKAVYLLVLFSSCLMFSQKKVSSNSIEVPIEVKNSFENEFKNVKPVWSTDYEGVDSQSQRYIATFRKDKVSVAAYYTKEGVQKVIEKSIDIKKLPKAIINYLNQNYSTYKINEAIVVEKDRVKLYEVGIGNKTKFFDVQFDATGYFLQMIEKNKH